jgi:hypothetical protein
VCAYTQERLRANRDKDVDEILGKKAKAEGGEEAKGHDTNVTMADAMDDDEKAALEVCVCVCVCVWCCMY